MQSNQCIIIHRLRKTVNLLIQSLKSRRRTVVPKRKQQNPLKIEKIKSKSVTHINGQSAVDFKYQFNRASFVWVATVTCKIRRGFRASFQSAYTPKLKRGRGLKLSTSPAINFTHCCHAYLLFYLSLSPWFLIIGKNLFKLESYRIIKVKGLC
jgi:hypothetical protein